MTSIKLCIRISALFLTFSGSQCSPPAHIGSCDSDQIEKIDKCLIGFTIADAITKLKGDTGTLHIMEGAAGLHGVRLQINPKTHVELFVKPVPAGSATVELKSKYGILSNSKITSVRWSNDNGANMHYAGAWKMIKQRRD